MNTFESRKTNAYLSKFYLNTQKSSIFEASYDQAYIASKKCKKVFSPTNLNREPIKMRNSQTFHSTVFTPIENLGARINPHKPKDHLSSSFFGSDTSEYIRKSITSDFQPNFQPDYKYQSTWRIDELGRNMEKVSKRVESEIRPVTKENLEEKNRKYIKKVEISSQNNRKLMSRCSTPQNKGYVESLRSLNTTTSTRSLAKSFVFHSGFNKNASEKEFCFPINRLGRTICHKFNEDNQVLAMDTWNKVAMRSTSLGYLNDTISSSKKKINLFFN